jgi:hypothetical protein
MKKVLLIGLLFASVSSFTTGCIPEGDLEGKIRIKNAYTASQENTFSGIMPESMKDEADTNGGIINE